MTRHMNETQYTMNYRNSKFYEKLSTNNYYYLENLKQNYTIHTFNVLNITGRVDYFEFTDDLSAK